MNHLMKERIAMPNRVENDAHDLALATPAKRDKAGVAGGARQRSSRRTSGLERRPRACGCKAATELVNGSSDEVLVSELTPTCRRIEQVDGRRWWALDE